MNKFLIFVKLIKLDPATNLAFVPPCHIQPQIIVSLDDFMKTWSLTEDANVKAFNESIGDLLTRLHQSFDCPISWQIQMDNIQEDFLSPPEWKKDQVFTLVSDPFIYDPQHQQTKIDCEFIWQWITDGKLY